MILQRRLKMLVELGVICAWILFIVVPIVRHTAVDPDGCLLGEPTE